MWKGYLTIIGNISLQLGYQRHDIPSYILAEGLLFRIQKEKNVKGCKSGERSNVLICI